MKVLTNEENNSIEPMITKDERDKEEGNSEEYSDASNQVNKMVDFLSNGSLPSV